jgi:hypothetical protein
LIDAQVLVRHFAQVGRNVQQELVHIHAGMWLQVGGNLNQPPADPPLPAQCIRGRWGTPAGAVASWAIGIGVSSLSSHQHKECSPEDAYP